MLFISRIDVPVRESKNNKQFNVKIVLKYNRHYKLQNSMNIMFKIHGALLLDFIVLLFFFTVGSMVDFSN